MIIELISGGMRTYFEASGATNAEIVKAARMGISYQVEVAKGRKLTKYVTVKPETILKYKG